MDICINQYSTIMQIKLKKGDVAPDFQITSPWSNRHDFFLDKQGKESSIIFFLRYYGCLICQLDIKRIKDNIDLFTQNNCRVYVIIQSTPKTMKELSSRIDWDFDIICDPHSVIYEKYGVSKGNIFQFLHPTGLPKVIQSLKVGHKHGKFEGEETQLPAVFRINSKNIIEFAHYGKHISDTPNFKEIIQ